MDRNVCTRHRGTRALAALPLSQAPQRVHRPVKAMSKTGQDIACAMQCGFTEEHDPTCTSGLLTSGGEG